MSVAHLKKLRGLNARQNPVELHKKRLGSKKRQSNNASKPSDYSRSGFWPRKQQKSGQLLKTWHV